MDILDYFISHGEIFQNSYNLQIEGQYNVAMYYVDLLR